MYLETLLSRGQTQTASKIPNPKPEQKFGLD